MTPKGLATRLALAGESIDTVNYVVNSVYGERKDPFVQRVSWVIWNGQLKQYQYSKLHAVLFDSDVSENWEFSMGPQAWLVGRL